MNNFELIYFLTCWGQIPNHQYFQNYNPKFENHNKTTADVQHSNVTNEITFNHSNNLLKTKIEHCDSSATETGARRLKSQQNVFVLRLALRTISCKKPIGKNYV